MSHLSSSTARLCLGLVLLVGTLLRCVAIADFDLWCDEELSILEATGTLKFNLREFNSTDILRANTPGNVLAATLEGDAGSGVLYIYSLRLWFLCFGTTILAARSFSLACGVLLMLAGYLLGRLLYDDRRVALVAALVLAAHPQLIQFAQMVRTYSLSLLVATMATYGLFRILRKGEGSVFAFTAYGLAVLMMLLTHYLSASIAGAHGLIWLLEFRRLRRRFLLAVPLIVVGLGLAAWLAMGGWQALELTAARNEAYAAVARQNPDDPNLPLASPIIIMQGWLQNLLYLCGISLTPGTRLRTGGLLLLVPLSVLVSGAAQQGARGRTEGYLLLLALAPLIFATVTTVASGHASFFAPRYSFFGVACAAILMAKSVSQVSTGKLTGASVVALAAYAWLTISSIWFHYSGLSPNAIRSIAKEPPVAEALSRIGSEPGTILHASVIEGVLFNLHYPPEAQISQRVDPGVPLGEVWKRVPGSQGILRVAYRDLTTACHVATFPPDMFR